MGYSVINAMDINDRRLVEASVYVVCKQHLELTGTPAQRYEAFPMFVLLTNKDGGKTKYSWYDCGFRFTREGKLSHLEPSHGLSQSEDRSPDECG